MDNRLLNAIYKSEKLYSKTKNRHTASLLIFRYIQASILSDEKSIYLQKALNIAVTTKLSDATDISMKLFEIYVYIKLKQYDQADEILKKLKSLKSWYKSERHYLYAIILILTSENEFEKGHISKGKKYYRQFVEQIQFLRNNRFFKMLQMNIAEKFIDDSFIGLDYNFKDRSILIYIKVYSDFLNDRFTDKKLVANSIKWAVIHQLDSAYSLVKIEKFFESNLNEMKSYTDVAQILYKKYKSIDILEILCKLYIEQARVDTDALMVYIESKKRLPNHIENLDYIYIMAAYKNDYLDVDSKTVQKVLSEIKLENDLQSFLYYLIITKEDMKYMLPINHYKIVNFGLQAFENNIKSFYYNQIYMFIFKEDNSKTAFGNYLFEHIFSYEIKILNPNIKYIWIAEKEIKDIKSYVVKDEIAIVNASSSDFDIFFLGIRQQNLYVPDGCIKVNKLLNVDTDIYKIFWENGFTSIEFIIVLSKYFISNGITAKRAEFLKRTLEYSELSDEFKCKISTELGKFYASNQQYDMASGYFSILSPDQIDSKNVDTAIISMLHADNLEKAIQIYNVKKDCVSDRVKLYICMTAVKNKSYQREISYLSFELLLKGRHEQEILNNVVDFYRGPISDFIKIKNMFDALNINSVSIEETILEKAVYSHRADSTIQDIFVHMYRYNYSNYSVKKFLDYIIGAILVEQKTVKNNVLECIESEYKNDKSEYIQCALAGVYIANNMEINNSRHLVLQRAIETMEKKEILFPIFKRYKDKTGEFSYLEKNVPFVYIADLGKQIYLNYRLKGENIWHKKEMKYERFGMYIAILTMFFNETFEYYIEDTSISSVNEKLEYTNRDNMNLKYDCSDEYYSINNAVICAETLRFSELEHILTEKQTRFSYMKTIGEML